MGGLAAVCAPPLTGEGREEHTDPPSRSRDRSGGERTATRPVPPAPRAAAGGVLRALGGSPSPGGVVSEPQGGVSEPPYPSLSSARRVPPPPPPPPAFKAQFVWAGPIPNWSCDAANGSRSLGEPANGRATCSLPANGSPVF